MRVGLEEALIPTEVRHAGSVSQAAPLFSFLFEDSFVILLRVWAFCLKVCLPTKSRKKALLLLGLKLQKVVSFYVGAVNRN